MADDTKAVEEPKKEPQEPVPSSEPAEAEVKAVDATVEADADADLPEGVSERTKEQFNKLKEANKALKEQLDKKAEIEPIFESMRPKTDTGLTQGQLDQVTDTDQYGNKFINEERLGVLLSQNTQKAEAAVAQVNRFIEDQQTREAFTAIPQLDPKNDKFDPELHKATRAFLLDSMVNPSEYGSRALSYKEAGEIAMKATNAEIAKVEQEANAQQSAKEQGSLEATGRSDRRTQTETSEEELRHKIRSGDENALASVFEES